MIRNPLHCRDLAGNLTNTFYMALYALQRHDGKLHAVPSLGFAYIRE